MICLQCKLYTKREQRNEKATKLKVSAAGGRNETHRVKLDSESGLTIEYMRRLHKLISFKAVSAKHTVPN